MAYSGLGAGTQADPYQITTVSQFKEMDNAAYAGVYFLLMNDLDFAAETIFTIANFYCYFDGGSHKLINLPINGVGLQVYSGSTIRNIEAEYTDDTRYVSGASFIGVLGFDTRTLSNFTITSVKVRDDIIRQDRNMSFASNGLTFDPTCEISNIIIEGRYTTIIRYSGALMHNISAHNRFQGRCPLVYTLQEGAVLQDFHYRKPFTDSSASCAMVANHIVTGTTIRRGHLSAGKLYGSAVSLLADSVPSASTGACEVTDLQIEAEILSATPTTYALVYLLFPQTLSASALRTFSRIWFTGNFENTVVSGSTNLFDAYGRTTYGYYRSDLLTSSTVSLSGTGQTGLNEAESTIEENFSTFSFVDVWQMTSGGPVLRGIAGQNLFTSPSGTCYIKNIERVSRENLRVSTVTAGLDNCGLEIRNSASELLFDGVITGDDTVAIIATSKDETLSVATYTLQGLEKVYLSKIIYTHLYNDSAINEQSVVCSELVSLDDSINKGIYIHGTVLVNDTIYGSARNSGSTYNLNGCIVKAPVSDISQYTLVPITFTDGVRAGGMDSIVKIGSHLYATVVRAGSGSNTNFILQYNLETDDYKLYRHTYSSVYNYGGPSCTDGTYWYVFVGLHRVARIDVTSLNSPDKFNEGVVWDVDMVLYDYVNYIPYSSAPHTMCVDDNHLYIGMGTPSLASVYEEQEIHKVDKVTMEYVAHVGVPKMTDDMCQTASHLFIGVELPAPYKDTTFGAGWGCCAIRKNDLRVTALPKLHSTDTATVNSYASLIFGNYLLDLKTNKYIYALDITDVDNWSLNENIADRTLKAYRMESPDGSLLQRPINEVFLHESGIFIGFAWGETSDIASFDLPGLNYFAAPTVITGDAAIIGDDDASISGYITSTGGKTVTAIGVILGQASDLSDGVDYPVTPVTTEFEKAFNDLEYGTYYFRVYATNAEGTGYGEIKSFTLEIPYTEPGQPTALDKDIQAEITISWTAPIDDGGTPVIGYKIQRKASGGEWVVIVADTGSTATTYTETLPQGVYQYRVSAITAYTTGHPSAILDINAVVGGGGGGGGMYRIYLGSTEIATIG